MVVSAKTLGGVGEGKPACLGLEGGGNFMEGHQRG